MWSVKVLSSKSLDTEPSILVTFDSGRYLINTGEGTTRAIMQSGYGFRKFQSILTSRISTDCLGGLPGMLMSLADSGSKKISVVGPMGLKHFLASARFHTVREGLYLTADEVPGLGRDWDAKPVYSDENISFFAFPLLSLDSNPCLTSSTKRKRDKEENGDPLSSNKLMRISASEKRLNPYISVHEEFNPTNLRGKDAEEWLDLLIQKMFRNGTSINDAFMPFTDPDSSLWTESTSKFELHFNLKQYQALLPRPNNIPCSLCYVGVAKHTRGKFDAKKADELGVKHGPERGILAKGQSVTLEDGTVITPDMCVQPPKPSASFIFVDCPHPSFIESLINEDVLKSRAVENSNLNLVIHVLGPGVWFDSRYQGWMRKFSLDVYHLVCSPEVNGKEPPRYTSAAIEQMKLSQLDPEIFPPAACIFETASPSQIDGTDSRIFRLQVGSSVQMRPAGSLKEERPAMVGKLINPQLHPETLRSFEQARKRIAEIAEQYSTSPQHEVVVHTLGTASAAPSKQRNVSATLIRIPRWGNILLDAGEGTFGQIARQFGTDVDASLNLATILQDLRFIFISHIHADHMIGAVRLLHKREKILEPTTLKPLFLLCNNFIYRCLRDYAQLEDLSFSNKQVFHIDTRDYSLRSQDPAIRDGSYEITGSDKIAELKGCLGLTDLFAVEMKHSALCHGLVIKHQDGWSISFSGDTMPSDKFVEASKDVTLMIHEATMADEERGHAIAKRHSTISQALDVGRRANSKHILLTHFSARYPKMPKYGCEEVVSNLTNWGIAVDGAAIPLKHMWKLNYYLAAMEHSYLDSGDKLDSNGT